MWSNHSRVDDRPRGAEFSCRRPDAGSFRSRDGTQTMRDALDYWHATREQGERSIGEQFEYNRFTRAWSVEHPDGTRAQLLSAWRECRRLPIDARGRA